VAIKAIGFDYGGVVKGVPGTVHTKAMCELLGVDIEDYRAAYFAHNKDVNRGDISWEQLWRLVLGELGKTEYLQRAIALDQARVADDKSKINTNVLDLADKLRAGGYKVGMLSNNTLEAGVAMRQMGIDKHFDVFHVSAETRLVKPEPEAFRYFAECLGVGMNEFVFIDDAQKSLSTAEECGFVPILYTDYESLIGSLSKVGVI